MKVIKYSIVPISIDNTEIFVDGKPANFEWFVKWILDNDTRFSTDALSLKAAVAIEKAFEYAKENSNDGMCKLMIDDIYYDKLIQAAQNPSVGQYPLRRARLCLPWIEIIENAE